MKHELSYAKNLLPSTVVLVVFALLCAAGTAMAAPLVNFSAASGGLVIRVDRMPVATYVWEDKEVHRPYFAGVHAPRGIQVTRNFPPDPEADRNNDDHATFHPGVWLAFGDLSGADFWRLKARVRHETFLEAPEEANGVGSFAVRNRYETNAGELICLEDCRYTIHTRAWGFLLTSASTFRAAERSFVFGDQEEMGLGVRLATPLTVRHGDGRMVNSEGGRNEAGTWGRSAAWCAGYAPVPGDETARTGIIVMTDPDNFRDSWFHTRDYGLIVANPFGKKAMTAPADEAVRNDATTVAAGDSLTLGFGLGLFVASVDVEPDFDAMYRDYLALRKAADR